MVMDSFIVHGYTYGSAKLHLDEYVIHLCFSRTYQIPSLHLRPCLTCPREGVRPAHHRRLEQSTGFGFFMVRRSQNEELNSAGALGNK